MLLTCGLNRTIQTSPKTESGISFNQTKIYFMHRDQFLECIEACLECASLCNHCAVSCLQENDVQMLTVCVAYDLETAILCETAAKLMTMNSTFSEEICQLCAEACIRCAEECEKHSHMRHCKECAEACRDCADACAEVAEHA